MPREAIMTDPEGLREKVARITDPDAWNWKPLPREPNEGPASKAAFDEQDRNDGMYMAHRRDVALSKADAILAALASSRTRAEAAEREVERLRKLAELEAARSALASPDSGGK
jgi:hypothetical protein